MTSVTWQVQGLRQLNLSFDSLQNSLRHNRPILLKGARAYYRVAEEVFDSEGQSAGLYWPELSERRVQERNGNDHPILEWMGDLRKAATQMGINSGPDILGGQRIIDNKARLYLQGDKARHNSGFVNDEGKNVPQREFWPWHDEQHELWFKPFVDYVDDWLANP